MSRTSTPAVDVLLLWRLSVSDPSEAESHPWLTADAEAVRGALAHGGVDALARLVAAGQGSLVVDAAERGWLDPAYAAAAARLMAKAG